MPCLLQFFLDVCKLFFHQDTLFYKRFVRGLFALLEKLKDILVVLGKGSCDHLIHAADFCLGQIYLFLEGSQMVPLHLRCVILLFSEFFKV